MSRTHEKYERLLERAQVLPPLPTAVAHPCDESSLTGAVDAARTGLIAPFLVGPPGRIRAVAEKSGVDLAGLEIVEAPHSHGAAARAVELVREGRAEALMKGSLHTDELMGEVVRRDTGLRTARRISHCFVMDVPGHPEVLIVTDAAGIVLGARVPIILTSRADSVTARLASCAVAALVAKARREAPAKALA